MANLHISEWKKLPVSLAELCLDTTLRCGQSFRWKRLPGNEWSCVLNGSIYVLKQDPTHLYWRCCYPLKAAASTSYPESGASSDEETGQLLRDYLNLQPNLTSLYEHWSSVDPNFKRRAPKFTGVRILKQDAWEALIGFICSSNNNIVRISQMVNNLCLHYGRLIGHMEGHAFHDFPTPNALTGSGVEVHLRELGFGYRARYIARTASMVAHEKPLGWLQSLCNLETGGDGHDALPIGGREGYKIAHSSLIELQGVGPKVADCVCLMGLGWGEAVPVDTHVWQIAQRDYKFGKGKHMSLTKATYNAVGDHFRQLWGAEAGWAHSVLFAADLKTFSKRVTTKLEIATENIEIKQESAETHMVLKREYVIDEVTDDTDPALSVIKAENLRAQRPKKRRVL